MARAGLGVTSFGMTVIDLPANFAGYPDHDHAEDGQEEVYTPLSGRVRLRVGSDTGEEHVLEPGIFARVGPDEMRQLITDDERARVLALGATPDQVYSAPAYTQPDG